MIVLRLLAATSLALVGACSAPQGDAPAKLKYWNDLIANELPAGTSKDGVLAFFSRNGLEPHSPEAGVVTAIEHDVQSDGFLVSTSVTFRCQLDSANGLESCKAELVSTGP